MNSIKQKESRESPDPISKLFCESQMIKVLECISCKQGNRSKPFEILEDPLLINVQEEFIDSLFSGIANFFQPKIQTRHCKICCQKQKHEVTVLVEKLPQILALRMGDRGGENRYCMPFQTLLISNKRKGNILEKTYFIDKETRR